MSKNPHIGSSLDDFLKEEGLYEDATNYAVKRVTTPRALNMACCSCTSLNC